MSLKTRWLWLGCIAVALVFCGCFLVVLLHLSNDRRLRAALPIEDQQVLDKGQKFILYSLHPRPMEVDPQELKTKPVFHGYMVLGQTQVTAANTRKRLLDALYDVVGAGVPNMCFNPRHGIRAIRGNKTVDLVICFECKQVEIYDEGGKRATTVAGSPLPVFDKVLTKAKVPLAGP